MADFHKKIRVFSIFGSTAYELDQRANFILNAISTITEIKGASIGQTYRTYESRTTRNAKSFINTPFFTNSITLLFDDEEAATIINNAFDDLRLQYINEFGEEVTAAKN